MSFRRITLILTALVAIFAMSVGLAGAQAVPAQGKWTGEVNAADASQLVVSGVRFQATGVAVDAGLTLATGTIVQVKFTAANGSLNAVKVERLEAGDDDLPGTGKITGTIDSATADSVSIGGVPFTVTGARIDDDASLNAGSLVELRFTFNGTALTVNRIEAEDDENDAKAIGVIETMDATTITVGGVAFDITGAQIDDDGVLAVGVLVEIEFTVAADGRVIALDIEFEDDDTFDDNDSNDDINDDRETQGAIEAMSGSTITVNGQVFDISQAVIDDEGTLAVGVVVDIDYVTASDGRNVALEVEIEGGSDSSDDSNDDDNISADFVLSGKIEAISGSSLTVNGITVDINGANIDDDDSLDIGDAVTIYFQRDASGALTVIEVDEIDDIDDPFDDDRDDDDDDDRDDWDDDNDSDDSSDDDDDVTVINGCVRPDGWQTYRVGRGDTLSRIAGAANTSVDALVAANCLTSANFITVGQTLFVPTRVNRLDDDNDDRSGDDDDDDDRGGDDDDDRDDDNGGDDDNDDDGDDDDDNGGDDDDDDDDDDDGDDD